MTLSLVLIAVIPVLLTAAIYAALPSWHRETFLFGVTVAPAFHSTAEAQTLLRRYRMGVLIVSFPCLLICPWALQNDVQWLFITGILLQPLAVAVLFARFHRRVLPFAAPVSSVRVANISPETEKMPGGWITAISPCILLALSAFYVRLHWAEVPARFPVHWDLNGAPNGWANRSFMGVYAPTLIGLLIFCFLLAIEWSILHGAGRGGQNPENVQWRSRFRHATLTLTVAIQWLICITFSYIVLLPFFAARKGPVGLWPILIGTLLTIGFFVWRLIRLNQEPGSSSDGTPDECWKWGGVYYNPRDPALMVERRFGIGYTVNFGNRMSWIMVGAFLLMMAGILLVVSRI